MRSIFLVVLFLSSALASAVTHLSSEQLLELERTNEQLSCLSFMSPTQLRYRGFLELQNGLEMFVKIEKPRWRKTKGWYFLVHGMLDSHRAWDQIVPALNAKGYGTIRMDLEGFARTLMHSHRRDNGTYAPISSVRYSDQILNLTHLLLALREQFQIFDPKLVGHSMGGGLVLAMAATEALDTIVAPDVYAFSPYVFRLERWEARKAFPIASATSTLLQGKVREKLERWTTNSITNAYMLKAYSDFFEEMLDKRPLGGVDLGYTDRQRVIWAHTRSAIYATQGLRDLDILREVSKIPPHFRIHHIAGSSDQLIDLDMQKLLADKFATSNPKVYTGLQTLEDIGHMVLDESPEQVNKILLAR